MKERVRVLVVDDSALMRKLIPIILERDPDIEVVGTAMDGAFAIRKIAELHPDVVTLDLEMPRMDGIETLRMIMRNAPLPVVVFSTHSKEGAYATFKALALGAIDFVAKPREAAAGHLDPVAFQLIEKIKVAKRAGGIENRSQAAGRGRRACQETHSRRASAQSRHRHWHFHRRPQRAPILVLPDSRRFSRHLCRRSAHAGRFYGDVCPAPR